MTKKFKGEAYTQYAINRVTSRHGDPDFWFITAITTSGDETLSTMSQVAMPLDVLLELLEGYGVKMKMPPAHSGSRVRRIGQQPS